MTVQISRTAQSPLRGQALRDTTVALMQQIANSREFRVARMQISRQGDRLIISAGNLMSGTVDFRDGNPSTVAVYMALRGLAEGPSMVQRVNAALDQAAIQLRSGAQAAATAPAAQVPAGGGVAPQPAQRQRAPRDPERAANIFSAIARSFETAVTDVFGPPAQPVAPAVVPDLPGQPPATPGRLRPTGKPLPPGGAGYTAPLQPVYVERDVPWGLVLAGSAVAVTGAVLLVKALGKDREDR